MSTRALCALVIAAVLSLAGWVLLSTGAADSAATPRQPLLAEGELPLDRVTRIELARPGSPALVFERTETGWAQTQPFQHPADPVALRQVLEAAASLQSSRAVKVDSLEPAARDALGLEKPLAVLSMRWPEGERVIELGKRTVAGRAWAHVRGRPTAASVDAALHELAVAGDPRQWRGMGLFEPAIGEAQEVVIRYGSPGAANKNPEWRMSRNGNAWRVLSPVQTRADTESVREYLESLARAQADAIAADQPADLAAFGLAPPLGGIQVKGRLQYQASLDVGNPVVAGAAERFARVDQRPAVMQLSSRTLATLFPLPATFVDPRGSDVVPLDIVGIEFTPVPGIALKPFILARAGSGWVVKSESADPGTTADADAVKRLLTQLTETRAPEVSFSSVPDDLRIGQLKLMGMRQSGEPLAVINVAREANAGKWALDNADGVLRVFPQNYDIKLNSADYLSKR